MIFNRIAATGLLVATLVGCSTVARSNADAFRDIVVRNADGRTLPARLYGADSHARPLVVVSNGYGGSHRDYSFIATYLVERGFVVASVQQDLATDPPIPTEGVITKVRRPFWDRGIATIGQTIADMRRFGIAGSEPVVLIGHSHGGDISMLYASLHPEALRAVISLDNRRVPLPRSSTPRICSIRSSDQQADEGVLPAPAEQHSLGMVILTAESLRHDDMWDGASPDGRRQILDVIRQCLGLPAA